MEVNRLLLKTVRWILTSEGGADLCVWSGWTGVSKDNLQALILKVLTDGCASNCSGAEAAFLREAVLMSSLLASRLEEFQRRSGIERALVLRAVECVYGADAALELAERTFLLDGVDLAGFALRLRSDRVEEAIEQGISIICSDEDTLCVRAFQTYAGSTGNLCEGDFLWYSKLSADTTAALFWDKEERIRLARSANVEIESRFPLTINVVNPREIANYVQFLPFVLGTEDRLCRFRIIGEVSGVSDGVDLSLRTLFYARDGRLMEEVIDRYSVRGRFVVDSHVPIGASAKSVVGRITFKSHAGANAVRLFLYDGYLASTGEGYRKVGSANQPVLTESPRKGEVEIYVRKGLLPSDYCEDPLMLNIGNWEKELSGSD